MPITKSNFKQDQENNNHLIQTLVTNFNPNSLKTDLFFCRLCRALIDILPNESLFWHGGVFVKRRLRTARAMRGAPRGLLPAASPSAGARLLQGGWKSSGDVAVPAAQGRLLGLLPAVGQ